MTHHYKPYHWEDREYGDNYYEFGEGEGRVVIDISSRNLECWNYYSRVIIISIKSSLKKMKT
jgi:hypothetical protein